MASRTPGDRQIGGRQLRPFRRVSDRRFLQVQDRDPGADQRRDRPVKEDQHRRRAIAGTLAVTIMQDLPNAGGAQPLAFHGQKCEFVDGIETSKRGTKFKAIDDPRRRPETDVLGAEITMPLDNSTVLDALR